MSVCNICNICEDMTIKCISCETYLCSNHAKNHNCLYNQNNISHNILNFKYKCHHCKKGISNSNIMTCRYCKKITCIYDKYPYAHNCEIYRTCLV